MKEKDILKTIIEYLQWQKIVYIRNNSGAMKTQQGGFIRFGQTGSPDIIAIQPKTGRFIGIECKVSKNKLSPAQEDFKQRCEESNGIFITARELGDILHVL